MGRKRNPGRIQAHDGSIASCRQAGDSKCSKRARQPLLDLPEEIWHHIHCLMPMRDTARAACVSHAFLCSWRCHPNLTFTKEAMWSKENLRKGIKYWDDKRDIREYNNNIGHILAQHKGAGVKTFRLDFHGPYSIKSYGRLNTWLQIAVTRGIEELDFTLSCEKAAFNFPCTHLPDSLRYLRLANCVLRPTFQLCLRSLKILYLFSVRITGDELGCLLSSSFALEQLNLVYCNHIVRLEIPCLLQRLSFMNVHECSSLQVIENKAPNISRFRFGGDQVQLSLRQPLLLPW